MDTFDSINNKENTQRNSHTLRTNIALFNPYAEKQYTHSHVRVYPDYHPDGIAVTSLDAALGYNPFFSLSKNKHFEWVVPELEEMACDKTVRFNKFGNQTITVYRVPASGYLVSKAKNRTKTKAKSKTARSKFVTNNQDNQISPGEHVIEIGGNTYSNKWLYYRTGTRFTKLKLPVNWTDSSNTIPVCQPDEQVYVSTKINWRKDSIDITYHHEIPIDYLSLHPSKPIFSMVHSDHTCTPTCSSESHCIRVLKNDPGYITKFDMYYRSSLTGGKWVKHGTFAGGTNWFEAAKVCVDSVLVKELRIVPIDFHSSWENTTIHSIGKVATKPEISSDTFVEYQVVTQHTPLNRVPDKYHYRWKEIHYTSNYFKNRINDKFQEMKERNFYPDTV